jgi:hypothetical protein
MKTILFYLFIIAVVGGGIYWWNYGADDTGKAADEFGTLPGAYSPMAMGDSGQLTYSYSVSLDYPASGALDFYQQKMTAKGWSPMDSTMFGTPNQWESGPNVDPETQKPSCEYKYVTVWTTPNKDRVTVLALAYFDPSANGACGNAPTVNKLQVTLEEMPTPKQ